MSAQVRWLVDLEDQKTVREKRKKKTRDKISTMKHEHILGC